MEPLHENPVCTELEAIGRVRARAATVLDVTSHDSHCRQMGQPQSSVRYLRDLFYLFVSWGHLFRE